MRNSRETKVIVLAMALLAITGHSRDINTLGINIPEANSQIANTQTFLTSADVIPEIKQLDKDTNGIETLEKINNSDDILYGSLLKNSEIQKIIESAEESQKEEEKEKANEVAQETTEVNIPKTYTDDEKLLATVIHAEAGICDEHEKLLVGSVVLNRVDSSHFPNTVSDVIYQKGQFVSVNGRVWREETPDESEYQIARKLIEGYRECPSNVVWFSKRCDFGTRYTKTEWHEYGAE